MSLREGLKIQQHLEYVRNSIFEEKKCEADFTNPGTLSFKNYFMPSVEMYSFCDYLYTKYQTISLK